MSGHHKGCMKAKNATQYLKKKGKKKNIAHYIFPPKEQCITALAKHVCSLEIYALLARKGETTSS